MAKAKGAGEKERFYKDFEMLKQIEQKLRWCVGQLDKDDTITREDLNKWIKILGGKM